MCGIHFHFDFGHILNRLIHKDKFGKDSIGILSPIEANSFKKCSMVNNILTKTNVIGWKVLIFILFHTIISLGLIDIVLTFYLLFIENRLFVVRNFWVKTIRSLLRFSILLIWCWKVCSWLIWSGLIIWKIVGFILVVLILW